MTELMKPCEPQESDRWKSNKNQIIVYTDEKLRNRNLIPQTEPKGGILLVTQIQLQIRTIRWSFM